VKSTATTPSRSGRRAERWARRRKEAQKVPPAGPAEPWGGSGGKSWEKTGNHGKFYVFLGGNFLPRGNF